MNEMKILGNVWESGGMLEILKKLLEKIVLLRKNEWMNEWTNEWMNEWMNELSF